MVRHGMAVFGVSLCVSCPARHKVLRTRGGTFAASRRVGSARELSAGAASPSSRSVVRHRFRGAAGNDGGGADPEADPQVEDGGEDE